METTVQKHASRKVSPSQIRAFKALANRIDAQEEQTIKTRGRAIFRRHGLVRNMVAKLRSRRIEMGLSLAEVASPTGIAKPNLSRLENSQRATPTLETLHRYAAALGMKVHVELITKN